MSLWLASQDTSSGSPPKKCGTLPVITVGFAVAAEADGATPVGAEVESDAEFPATRAWRTFCFSQSSQYWRPSDTGKPHDSHLRRLATAPRDFITGAGESPEAATVGGASATAGPATAGTVEAIGAGGTGSLPSIRMSSADGEAATSGWTTGSAGISRMSVSSVESEVESEPESRDSFEWEPGTAVAAVAAGISVADSVWGGAGIFM